ncbi:Uncharacterised protein [uncultured Clostridium sp.]|nr:Uncharacterised protein [uncultured Clostridium sp.]
MMTWLMRRFWMPISKKTGVAVSIYLLPILHHGAPGHYMVEIEIINAPALEEREKSGSAFYLLSVITA